VGLHRIGVITPLGVPEFVSFAVDALPASSEGEPNDDPAAVKTVALPTTLVGTIERPGDVDHFRFEAKAGQQLVCQVTARALGARLQGVLTLLDDKGRVLGEAAPSEGHSDPVLTATVRHDGIVTLRVADADFGGSGDHFYRIAAGFVPYITSVFPLGVTRGATTQLQVQGVNLQGLTTVPMNVAPQVEAGAMVEAPIALPGGARPVNRRMIVVADGPQLREDDSASSENGNPSRHHAFRARRGLRPDRPGS